MLDTPCEYPVAYTLQHFFVYVLGGFRARGMCMTLRKTLCAEKLGAHCMRFCIVAFIEPFNKLLWKWPYDQMLSVTISDQVIRISSLVIDFVWL